MLIWGTEKWSETQTPEKIVDSSCYTQTSLLNRRFFTLNRVIIRTHPFLSFRFRFFLFLSAPLNFLFAIPPCFHFSAYERLPLEFYFYPGPSLRPKESHSVKWLVDENLTSETRRPWVTQFPSSDSFRYAHHQWSLKTQRSFLSEIRSGLIRDIHCGNLCTLD